MLRNLRSLCKYKNKITYIVIGHYILRRLFAKQHLLRGDPSLAHSYEDITNRPTNKSLGKVEVTNQSALYSIQIISTNNNNHDTRSCTFVYCINCLHRIQMFYYIPTEKANGLDNPCTWLAGCGKCIRIRRHNR